MNDGPGTRPTPPPEPRHPAPPLPGSGAPTDPRITTFHYESSLGPAGGCLFGAAALAVFMVFAILMLAAGGVFALFGGRRMAAALFRRALRRNALRWKSGPGPDVIDVQATDITENH